MEPEGHRILSRQAFDEAVKSFPQSMQWIHRLLMDDVVHFAIWRDVSFGHFTDTGQRHHFGRAEGESELDAYRNGVKWVRSHAEEASKSFRKLWKRKTTGDFPMSFIGGPLGYAFHALQDSFTPSHVNREKIGDKFYITRIYVYDDTIEPRGAWPGHAPLDKVWADKSWADQVGREVVAACRELTKIVVWASLAASEAEYKNRWTKLWSTYADMFLATRFHATVRAPAAAAPHLRERAAAAPH